MIQNLNKEIVPESGANLKFKNGLCVAAEAEKTVVLYIDHETETQIDENGQERTIVRAVAVEVEKPVTRAKAINAIERLVYGLESVEHLASFNASLARKARIGEDLEEVEEHDQRISWAKQKLTDIGITK